MHLDDLVFKAHIPAVQDFIDFETLIRPTSPNTYLLAPEALCRSATPDDISPVFDHSPQQLLWAITTALEGENRISISARDAGSLRLKAVATTALLRFKDDIDVAALSVATDENRSQLAVYSRSRIGYSDLGANAKRVRMLLEKLGST